MSIEVLEHIPNPIKTLETMGNCLKKNGYLILTESFNLLGKEYPSHLSGHEKLHDEFIPTIESLGFSFLKFEGPDKRFYLFKKINS